MKSSLQADLGDGWGDNGFQWPEWLDDFDEPVVRTTAKSWKKMHAPDLTAAEPQAACDIGNRGHQSRPSSSANSSGGSGVNSQPQYT